MTPLVSAIFKGPALTPHHDLAPGQATVGHPGWGHRELLENLELRLGLPRREIGALASAVASHIRAHGAAR